MRWSASCRRSPTVIFNGKKIGRDPAGQDNDDNYYDLKLQDDSPALYWSGAYARAHAGRYSAWSCFLVHREEQQGLTPCFDQDLREDDIIIARMYSQNATIVHNRLSGFRRLARMEGFEGEARLHDVEKRPNKHGAGQD
jgi:hypothetical protein